MRYAIKGQIRSFRQTHTPEESKCAICLTVIETDNVHIHHATQSFDDLANTFIQQQENPPNTFDDDTETHQARFQKKDHLYEKQWQKYHSNHAHLTLTHAKCNLSEKRRG